jgi:hypothetical protein
MGTEMIDVRAYKRDGYLLLRGFFDPLELDAVRAEAKQIFISQMRRHAIVATDELLEDEFAQGMFQLLRLISNRLPIAENMPSISSHSTGWRWMNGSFSC